MDIERLLVLKDMNGEAITDVVIFDKTIDKAKVKEAVDSLWGRECGWTFDDLLEVLDNFGDYTIAPLSTITTIEY